MKKLLQTLFFFLLVAQICFAQPVSPSASQGGWFWQNPLPQGNGLWGVSFTDANNGTAVGEGGTGTCEQQMEDRTGLFRQADQLPGLGEFHLAMQITEPRLVMMISLI